jgi:hypothetical protein
MRMGTESALSSVPFGTEKGDIRIRGEFNLTRKKMPDGAARRFPSVCQANVPISWSSNICSHTGRQLRVFNRRDARASPNGERCVPIGLEENVLPLPTVVQERGRSTSQRKMRSHTIENRFYAM